MSTTGSQPASKHDEALVLAAETLELFERIDGSLVPVLLRVMRIARLVSNSEVEQWMRLELRGYRAGVTAHNGEFLPYAAWSGREGNVNADGKQLYHVLALETIEAELIIARSALAAAAEPVPSVAEQASTMIFGKTAAERLQSSATMNRVTAEVALRKWTRIIASVRGGIYDWLSRELIQLQYGHLVEDAFVAARTRVDAYLRSVAPEVGNALAAAAARADSADPEEWSQALASCRRALKALADAVYPATTDEIDGHKLGSDDYLNRLTQFVKEQTVSGSRSAVLREDLAAVHRRAEALNSLASKGVHSATERADLEMAVVHTYLFAGEILELAGAGLHQAAPPNDSAVPVAEQEAVSVDALDA